MSSSQVIDIRCAKSSLPECNVSTIAPQFCQYSGWTWVILLFVGQEWTECLFCSWVSKAKTSCTSVPEISTHELWSWDDTGCQFFSIRLNNSQGKNRAHSCICSTWWSSSAKSTSNGTFTNTGNKATLKALSRCSTACWNVAKSGETYLWSMTGSTRLNTHGFRKTGIKENLFT